MLGKDRNRMWGIRPTVEQLWDEHTYLIWWDANLDQIDDLYTFESSIRWDRCTYPIVEWVVTESMNIITEKKKEA